MRSYTDDSYTDVDLYTDRRSYTAEDLKQMVFLYR